MTKLIGTLAPVGYGGGGGGGTGVEPPPFAEVAGGLYHTLFRTQTGDVWTCGYNSHGQLARDDVPVGSNTVLNLGKVGGLSNIVKVAAANNVSCFLTASGVPYTCGDNVDGALGRTNVTTTNNFTNLGPVGLSNIVDVAVGSTGSSYNFIYFLSSSGVVYSCGHNAYGQLGKGSASGSNTSSNLSQISGIPTISAMAVGGYGAFFLKGDGTLYSCGFNHYGQLGRTVSSGTESVANLGLSTELSGVAQVACGGSHTLFLTSEHKAYSCGETIRGALGRNATDGCRSLVNLGMVPKVSNVISVAAGYNASFFVEDSGKVWSCGDNTFGGLGRIGGASTRVAQKNLGRVPDLTVADVKVFNKLLCVKTADSAWYSCGDNISGDLGRVAPSGDQYEPGLTKIVSPLSVRDVYPNFLLTTYGSVYSFGQNGSGQLGRVTPTTTGSVYESNLGEVTGLPNITDVFSSGSSNFFITTSGLVYSCGSNSAFDLGHTVYAQNGTVGTNLTQVPGLSSVKTIVNRPGYHTFFLTTAGAVYSCGDNSNGQLGRTGTGGPAAAVPNLSSIVEILIDQNTTYFRSSAGLVYSCGNNNYGQLGHGASTGNSNFINLDPVSQASNVVSMAAISSSAYFLSSSGSVWTCGNNSQGQLGRATVSGSPILENLGQVTALSDVRQVVAGSASAFFLTGSGTVYSCGTNYSGILGRIVANGTTDGNLGVIPDLPPIVSAHIVNNNSVLFLTDSGDVWSCGFNNYGELGRAVASGSETSSNLGKIDGLPPVAKIFSYGAAVFFLTTSGELWSCGNNEYGLLGRSTASGVRPVPNLGRVLLAA